MSSALYSAEQALAYTAPPELPIVVLAVGYGEEQGTPDPWPTVEATWRHTGRPGMFTTVTGYSDNWPGRMDAALRVAVFRIESLYAILGGWPEPTPLDAYPPLPPVPGAV